MFDSLLRQRYLNHKKERLHLKLLHIIFEVISKDDRFENIKSFISEGIWVRKACILETNIYNK